MTRLIALIIAFIFTCTTSVDATRLSGTKRALLAGSGLLPFVADSGHASGTTSVSGVAFSKGAPPNGYLMIAFASTNGSSATVTQPAGWSALDNQGGNGAWGIYYSPALFYKVAQGEGASYTWATTSSGANIEVIMVSIKNGSAVGLSACGASASCNFNGAFSGTTSITSGAVTPIAQKDLVLAGFYGWCSSGNFTGAFTIASGWSNIYTSGLVQWIYMAEYRNALTSNLSSVSVTSTLTTACSYSDGGYTVVVPGVNV